jgi:hypothetical protein
MRDVGRDLLLSADDGDFVGCRCQREEWTMQGPVCNRRMRRETTDGERAWDSGKL